MTDLCILAEKYGSDKCPKIHHTYTPEYNRLLQHLRDSAKLVVEIGIGYPALMVPIVGHDYKPGASLRVWRDYFKNAQIVGADIRADVIFNDHRIKCLYTDQSSIESLIVLKSYCKLEYIDGADLVLDDGSHIPDHQILSFKMLWSLVKPGGFYIIEDVRREHLEIMKGLPHQFDFKDCKLVYTHLGKNNWDSFCAFQKLI